MLARSSEPRRSKPPTMVRPADEARRWRGWWSFAPSSRRSRSTGRSELDRGVTYRHALVAEPRRARAARAADGAEASSGRPIPSVGRLRDSRSDQGRARPARGRLQPRAPRADRLCRPAVDRPASVRQPGPARAPRPSSRRPDRAAGEGASSRFQGGVRQRPLVSVDGRRDRARTSIARRTISAWWAS